MCKCICGCTFTMNDVDGLLIIKTNCIKYRKDIIVLNKKVLSLERKRKQVVFIKYIFIGHAFECLYAHTFGSVQQ